MKKSWIAFLISLSFMFPAISEAKGTDKSPAYVSAALAVYAMSERMPKPNKVEFENTNSIWSIWISGQTSATGAATYEITFYGVPTATLTMDSPASGRVSFPLSFLDWGVTRIADGTYQVQMSLGTFTVSVMQDETSFVGASDFMLGKYKLRGSFKDPENVTLSVQPYIGLPYNFGGSIKPL